mgnify:CR=1 FL=1
MENYEYYVLENGQHCVVDTKNSYDCYNSMTNYYGDGTEIEVPNYYTDDMLVF